MNDLSWLLYLGDVAGSLGVAAVSTAILFLLMCCGALILWLHGADFNEDAQKAAAIKWGWKRFFPAMLASTLIAVLIPSKQTIYLIAASEMGERTFQTETGKKALAALNRYLDTIGVETNEADKKE